MARKFIKKYLPDRKKLQKSKWLRLFGSQLHNANLWLLNRSSVATASTIGILVAFLPIPGHMLLAALFAILLRANLPFSVLLVWVANPFTMVPMYGLGYTIGATLLGVSVSHFDAKSLLHFHEVWEPLFLGCILCGATLGILSNIAVRSIWRYQVVKNWQKRHKRRLVKNTALPSETTD